MRRNIIYIALILAAFLGFGVLLLTWFDGEPDPAWVALRANDPQTVAQGQAVYAEHCASCHGTQLQGQPNWRQRLVNGRLPAPPHDGSGHTWHHPDQQLFALTKYGPAALVGGDYDTDMPAYSAILTDDEIIAVLSYIKSTWPEETQRRHDQINARTRAAQ